jgi:hypothetical protein
MELLKIRIDRKEIRKFPFDLIYIVKAEDRRILPRIFPTSLCFAIDDKWQKMLLSIPFVKEEFQQLQERRAIVRGQGKLHESSLNAHFLVVPILTHAVEPYGSRHPAYFTAQRHVKSNENKFSEIFTDEVVLFTKKGPIRPICLGCPRHLLQIQGQCQLGGRYCYDTLVLDRPQPPKTPEEPGEQLQSDDADPSGNTV